MKALIKSNSNVSIKDILVKNHNDVLIKVNTIGLCRTDLLVANNTIKTEQEELILGHEFSGIVVEDKTGQLKANQVVGVNPLWDKKFMGLDFDGAICEYISIPSQYVIPTTSNNMSLVAYLEPTAASMAVLKVLSENDKNKKIAIVGKNRIAYLTYLILQNHSYNVDYLDSNDNFPVDYYDIMIETMFDEKVLHQMIQALKVEGTLIIKSRKKTPVGLISSDLVAKEITLRAVNYFDFHQSMRWIEKNENLLIPLLGRVFPLNDWENAFSLAQSGEDKKIFIKM